MWLSFNPRGHEQVNQIKVAFANVFDILNTYLDETDDGDVERMLSVAINQAQSAQMRGVKGVTGNS
jgi:hypothetical protein